MQLISLEKVLLLQPIILSITNVFVFLLQFRNKILVFSLSPVMYNVGGIIGAAFLYPVYGISGLAYGVLLGAFLQLFFVLINLAKLHYVNLKLKYKFVFSDVVYLVKHAFPRTVSLIISQLRVLSIVTFGAFLGVGAISAYSLSYAIYFVPINIFAVAYVIAIYPKLCREEDGSLEQDVKNAYNYLLFVTLPIVVIFVLLRAHIVRILYGGTGFSWENTTVVAASLGILALSIPFYAFKVLSQRLLFAKGVIWRQSVLEFLLFILQGIFIYFFVKHLQIFETIKYSNIFRLRDVNDFNSLIIPIVFVILTIVDFVIFHILQMKMIKVNISKNISSILYANLIFAFMLYAGLRAFDFVLRLNFFINKTFLAVLTHAALSFVFGAIFWYAALKIFKNKEVTNIESVILNRFWKKKIDAPHDGIEVVQKV
jgi:putative peptidoglycan lipid II flippase